MKEKNLAAVSAKSVAKAEQNENTAITPSESFLYVFVCSYACVYTLCGVSMRVQKNFFANKVALFY